jgi:hypothetical protein
MQSNINNEEKANIHTRNDGMKHPRFFAGKGSSGGSSPPFSSLEYAKMLASSGLNVSAYRSGLLFLVEWDIDGVPDRHTKYFFMSSRDLEREWRDGGRGGRLAILENLR